MNILEVGEKLFTLRAKAKRGSFGVLVAELGISGCTAQSYISIFLKFGGDDSRRVFAQQKSRAVLQHLAQLPDQVIDSGIKSGALDELTRLPFAEFRKELRKLHDRDEARQRDHEAQMDQLCNRLNGLRLSPSQDRLNELLGDVSAIAFRCREAIGQLNAKIRAVYAAYSVNGKLEPDVVALLEEHIRSVKQTVFVVVK